jgi:hypothetical protein
MGKDDKRAYPVKRRPVRTLTKEGDRTLRPTTSDGPRTLLADDPPMRRSTTLGREEERGRIGGDPAHLIRLIKREGRVIPLGTQGALDGLVERAKSGQRFFYTLSNTNKVIFLKQLGFSTNMADTLLRHIPDIKYLAPVPVGTCNTLAFAMTERDIYALKSMERAQGETEVTLLNILAEPEFGRLHGKIPRHRLSKHYSNGTSLLVTTVERPGRLDKDERILERMRTIGLLHGYSPRIKSHLRARGISLGRKDYGDIRKIIRDINSKGELLGPFEVRVLEEEYPACVEFLQRYADRSSMKYVVHMDTKDENWAPWLLDFAVAKEDDAKHHDYSRSVFDMVAQEYRGRPADLFMAAFEAEDSVSPNRKYRIFDRTLNENFFLTITAGIVDLPRLVASNVTKGKREMDEVNQVYLTTLQRLIRGRLDQLPSYRYLIK